MTMWMDYFGINLKQYWFDFLGFLATTLCAIGIDLDHYDFDFLGFLAATLSAIALLPQIHQIWVTRSAKDISFAMLALLLSGSIVQMIYAILTYQPPIIITNCISISLRTMVLACKIYMDWRASQHSS